MRRPIGELAATTEVEDHRRGNDRNDLMWLETDRPPSSCRLQALHDAASSRQPVRATAREDDSIDPVHQRRRVQQVCLPGARAAATYVDSTDRALVCQHNCRPSQPAFAICGVVADLKALDHPLILPICPC